MSEEHIKYMLSKIPRNRFLKVEEAASMVFWLCSSENSFTTGGVFNLSGVAPLTERDLMKQVIIADVRLYSKRQDQEVTIA